MSALPSPRFYEILPPETRSAESPAFRLAGHESEWFASGLPPDSKAAPRFFARLLVMLFLGAFAVLAWQAYGHAARAFTAGLSPQLRWLAPRATVADAAPDSIEQITRSVDRIAGNIAASQEQITRSIDHLAAGQEHMTREIIRLQAISQYASNKSQEPPQQPAPGPVHKALHRAAQPR
jgi:hypothetical protein